MSVLGGGKAQKAECIGWEKLGVLGGGKLSVLGDRKLSVFVAGKLSLIGKEKLGVLIGADSFLVVYRTVRPGSSPGRNSCAPCLDSSTSFQRISSGHFSRLCSTASLSWSVML